MGGRAAPGMNPDNSAADQKGKAQGLEWPPWSCRASDAVLGDCLELISRVEQCKGPCCHVDCASLTQGWHRAQDVELKVLSASCLSLFCQNLPYPAQGQCTTPALLHSKSWMKYFGLDYLNFTELWTHLPTWYIQNFLSTAPARGCL